MRWVGFLGLGVAAVVGPLSAHAAGYSNGFGAGAWAVTPEDSLCQTELELVSRSGAIAPIAFVSDGDHVALRFTKAGVPSEAFLPIRVDGKPYSNLVQRDGDEGLAIMNLSEETQAALRRGKTLQIAWLGDEAVATSLAGAGQVFQTALGVTDGKQWPGHAIRLARDQRGAGLGVERGAHEIVTVAIVALQRHEQVALFQGAGVNRKPVHGKGRAGLAQRGGFSFWCRPQHHAARPPSSNANFTASSRSEKG